MFFPSGLAWRTVTFAPRDRKSFGAHGDATRPVLAVTSVADTFALTIEAFNIAEQYQTPVILLSDGDIGQRKETFDPPRTWRYPFMDEA